MSKLQLAKLQLHYKQQKPKSFLIHWARLRLHSFQLSTISTSYVFIFSCCNLEKRIRDQIQLVHTRIASSLLFLFVIINDAYEFLFFFSGIRGLAMEHGHNVTFSNLLRHFLITCKTKLKKKRANK